MWYKSRCWGWLATVRWCCDLSPFSCDHTPTVYFWQLGYEHGTYYSNTPTGKFVIQKLTMVAIRLEMPGSEVVGVKPCELTTSFRWLVGYRSRNYRRKRGDRAALDFCQYVVRAILVSGQSRIKPIHPV